MRPRVRREGQVRDVPDDLMTRAALAASEARFRSLVATSGDVIVVLDERGDVSYASPALERVTGWRPEAIVGRASTELAGIARRGVGSGEFTSVLSSGGQPTTFPFQHRDGRWRHLEVTAVDLRGNPEVGGYVLNLRDVTERVQAQVAREAADARFRALVQHAADLIICFGPDRTVTYTSPAVTRLLGFGPDELLGVYGPTLGHPDEAEAGLATFAKVVAAGPGATAGPYEVRMGTAAGGWREVEVRLTNLLDDPAVGALVLNVHDLSERNAAQRAVARSEIRYRRMIETAPEAVFVHVDGQFVFANAAAAAMLGVASADELVGRVVLDFIHPSHYEDVLQRRVRLAAGETLGLLDSVWVRTDGTEVHGEITATSTEFEGRPAIQLVVRDLTELVAARAALAASEARFRSLVQNSSDPIVVLDESLRVTYASPAMTDLLGFSPDGTTALDGSRVHPDDRERVVNELAVCLGQPGGQARAEYRLRHADGTWRYVEAVATNLLTEPTVSGVILNLHDATERVEADQVRQAAESRFEIGFEQAAIGAVISDLRGHPIRVNPAMCTLLGRPADQLVGRRWTEYTYRGEVPLGQAVSTRVADGYDTFEDERRYVRPDGTIVWASAHVSLVRDESGEPQYFFAQFQDITRRKQMEQELAHQALHDSLTGLPNRALLTDRLIQGLAGSRRRGAQLGVMFLDLDHFKVINDSLGHSCGDELLRYAAQQIAGAIRPGDTVARFGGDEFVVVCDDISTREAQEIAGRILSALSQPCMVGDQEMTITASIGVAVAANHDTPEHLLRDADTAMYRAKDRGRGRVELFNDAMRSMAEQRLATASALRRALDRGEFTLHFQPIVDLSTGMLVSAEALLRWEHPTHGLISPNEFVALAEETGLIVPIGAWVLEQACEQSARWQRSMPAMSIAVNLSVRQILDPGIAAAVANVLDRTGSAASGLCLELTESVFMDDADSCGQTLTELKALGVSLSIDDFGTGYSALSYLKRFPLDGVKVDRSFVDGLGTDPHHSALVAAIVAMAKALGLDVTAEGVETHQQLAILQRLGCERAQGFHLDRPMTASAMDRVVAESRHWPVALAAAPPSPQGIPRP